MHDLESLYELAVELATNAGQILLDRRAAGIKDVRSKTSAEDIVTEADLASENYIAETLREHRPDDSILGEEGTAETGSSGIRWVVDPLDGTVNFAYGIPHYAVSVGVEIDGEAVIGAVYRPATSTLFRAMRGAGAFRNDEPISVRSPVALEQCLVATGFSYWSVTRAEEAAVLGRVLPVARDIRRSGSAALDLCSVAEGTVDVYYQTDVKPWDITGAEVVASEAGARVTGYDGGRPTTSILACHPETYDDLARLILET